MKRILLIAILILPAWLLSAQVSLQLSSDTNMVHIGDTFDLKLVWSYDNEAQVSEPLTDSLRQIPDLEIRRESDWVVRDFNGTIARTKTFTCAYMNVGLLRIAPLAAPYTYEKRKNQALSEELIIEVRPLAPKQDEILPIKDALFEPRNIGDYLPWILLGLALVGGIVAAVLWWRRRPKKAVQEVLLPADAEARRQIQTLRESLPWSGEDIQSRYTSITDIARAYLQARFEIPARVETYRQISRLILRLHPRAAESDALLQALQTAEFVKFAKVSPDPETNTDILDHLERFVNANPMPVAEPEKAQKP